MSFGLEALPGQQILPGFKEAMRIDAHSLKPFDEEFCQLYVELGSAGQAYQAVAKKFKNKEVSDLQAQKNGSALRKKEEISRRIAQYQAVTRAACQHEVIAYNLSAMRFDPAAMFNDSGKQKRVHELPEEQRKMIGLEARVYDGGVVYIPVFPDKQKGCDNLMRMMAMDKQAVELSGAGGSPLTTGLEVTFVTSKG